MYIVCIHVFVDPADVVSPRPFQESEKGLVTVWLYCIESVVFLLNIALSYAGVTCLVRLSALELYSRVQLRNGLGSDSRDYLIIVIPV